VPHETLRIGLQVTFVVPNNLILYILILAINFCNLFFFAFYALL
jgi:hypothetical protein